MRTAKTLIKLGVFAGCTCHFVGFVMLLHIYFIPRACYIGKAMFGVKILNFTVVFVVDFVLGEEVGEHLLTLTNSKISFLSALISTPSGNFSPFSTASVVEKSSIQNAVQKLTIEIIKSNE